MENYLIGEGLWEYVTDDITDASKDSLAKTRISLMTIMKAYLNEVMPLAHKVNNIGSPIHEEFIGVIMLNELTDINESMIIALEAGNVKSHLIVSELLQK